MNGTRAVNFQLFHMQLRAIALVLMEMVTGILFVHLQHYPVPRHFSDNGRGGNGFDQFISIDNSPLLQAKVRNFSIAIN